MTKYIIYIFFFNYSTSILIKECSSITYSCFSKGYLTEDLFSKGLLIINTLTFLLKKIDCNIIRELFIKKTFTNPATLYNLSKFA